MAMTLGTKVPELIGQDFADGTGAEHAGLFRYGLPVLKARPEQLRELREKAVAAEVGVVTFPVNGHQTNDYEEFVTMLGSSVDVGYLGLALYGPARAVRKLTGAQFGEFVLRLNVAGEVEKKDDRFLVGTGCQAHACNSDMGFIGIDRKARDVFLAMRSRQRVTAWPAVDRWPAPLRADYESWRKM